MNLFILDQDPYIAATYYQDLHVNKIIIEGAQMLAAAYPLDRLAQDDVPKTQKGRPRRHAYQKHPMTIWVTENLSNFQWTIDHITALCNEYEYRFDRPRHFTRDFIDWCDTNLPDLPNLPQTLQPQCFTKSFPECLVEGDPVAGYQNYYNTAKTSFKFGSKIKYATWTKRPIPYFYSPKTQDSK